MQAKTTLPDIPSNLNRRPCLTHLNADTSWLLSIPRPDNDKTGRSYFHLLLDPWLKGGQSDVTKLLSQQWHAIPSALQTIKAVDELAQQLEDAISSATPAWKPATFIDAVVVSHEFTDHMHQQTLLEVDPSVPVYATAKAANIIASWKHFKTVNTVEKITGSGRDWKETSKPPLPAWLGICRVAYEGSDMLYYHSAVLITWQLAPDQKVEACIYTPHGIAPEDLKPVASAMPPIHTLALLHGLHDIQVGAQLNLGAHNGLKAQRLLNAKYWIGTHDEVKRGGGIVSWFLKRKVLTVEEALEQEIKKEQGDAGEPVQELDNVHFVDLQNGESLILEDI